jgi:hypothetical protein
VIVGRFTPCRRLVDLTDLHNAPAGHTTGLFIDKNLPAASEPSLTLVVRPPLEDGVTATEIYLLDLGLAGR